MNQIHPSSGTSTFERTKHPPHGNLYDPTRPLQTPGPTPGGGRGRRDGGRWSEVRTRSERTRPTKIPVKALTYLQTKEWPLENTLHDPPVALESHSRRSPEGPESLEESKTLPYTRKPRQDFSTFREGRSGALTTLQSAGSTYDDDDRSEVNPY